MIGQTPNPRYDGVKLSAATVALLACLYPPAAIGKPVSHHPKAHANRAHMNPISCYRAEKGV
jgi:hypothetical protein